MFSKLTLVIVFSCFLSFCFSENTEPIKDPSKQLIKKAIIGIEAGNIRKNKEGYLIDIYANNMNKNIAGIQFELIGEDFTILEVSGGLAETAGFNFYNGARGVILAFSLEGKTISQPKKRTPLLVLKVQKNNSESSEFKLKTLIAGERGVKLESTFTPLVIK